MLVSRSEPKVGSRPGCPRVKQPQPLTSSKRNVTVSIGLGVSSTPPPAEPVPSQAIKMQQSPFGLRLLQLAQLQPANASTPQPSSILLVQQRLGVQDLVLRFTPFLTLFALACSLLHLVVRQTRKGRIALPASSDGADLPSTTADDVKVKHDPFDLYDPEVYEDGVPLNETSFWRRVKTYGRLPLLVLSVVVLGVRITILVLPLVQGTNLSTFVLLSDIVAIGYYTYVLSLVVGYQGLTDVPSHWRMTLHIASLFGTIATCKGLETLLPKGDPANKALPTTAIERILDWVELGCVTVSFCLACFTYVAPVRLTVSSLLQVATTISVLIPRGPKLYFPMSKLYTSFVHCSFRVEMGERRLMTPCALQEDRRRRSHC